MKNFDILQIADWRSFEKVRLSGRFNMFSREAREAAGLRREEWFFCMKHYAALKAAEAASTNLFRPADPRDTIIG